MKPIKLNDRGVFSFCWDGEFFIESNLFAEDVEDQRNYVFSDVSYGGEGDGAGNSTIRPYYGSIRDWANEKEYSHILPKGQHRIKDFCGETVKILKS